MIEKKRLPVGKDDFAKLRKQNCYYVDKTGLIKDLLLNMSEVTLFTRPRRFGKSLNMSMLRHFFEIETDPALFEGLVISDEEELCEEHMGKYPVISISLRDIEGTDFRHAQKKLTNTIRKEVRRHQYLLESSMLSDIDKDEYGQLISVTLSNDILEDSLGVLSELLAKHHNQKVIILIDEYDVPLAKAYEHGYYDDMVILVRNILHQALKSNEYLQFAVLTGCMRIAKESIFTGLNNPKVQSITNKRYDEYFGFTEDEIKEMLVYYELDECYSDIKAWYNGYLFGDEYVYCPWSVINYLDDRRNDPDIKPINYWANSSGNNIIKKLLVNATPEISREIERLIDGGTITKQIQQDVTYAEIDQSVDNIWSVMFTTGYLTSVRPANASTIQDIELKIPNEEVRSTYENHIKAWFMNYVKTDVKRYTEFNQAFADADVQKIQYMLNSYLSETISIRDTFVRDNTKENFYHGFLLAMLNFCGEWRTESNVESGNGFSHISLQFKTRPIGIVIELKYGKSDKQENLDAGCREAMAQIEEKRYTDKLKKGGCKHIYKYGIAFFQKQCKVVMDEEIVE